MYPILCKRCRDHSFTTALPDCEECPKHKVPNLLIRVPKTASGSLTKTKGISTYHKVVPKIGHNTALQLREFLGEEDYSKRFTFAIVRNPYDRLVSAYHYFCQISDCKWGKILAKEFPTFKQFCYQFARKKYHNVRQHFRLQKEFVVDKNNDIIVDYVGRFEQLPQVYSFIKEKLQLDDSLIHHNKSKHIPWQSHYDAKCQEIVYREYKEDFDFFGYPKKIYSGL